MKLTELLTSQRIIIQLSWGEQKIEFFSDVVEKYEDYIFVTPYIHNGSPLELNVTNDKGVICNIYADNPVTNQRVSWKGVELTTTSRNSRTLYCIKTRGFNTVAMPDDRRLNERVIVDISGIVYDGANDDGTYVTIHDISDVGVSFYAPDSFKAKSPQIMVTFTDNIEKRIFDVKVECSISRTGVEGGRTIVGCRTLGDNKDYKLYGLMRRLISKNVNKSEGKQEENTIAEDEHIEKQEENNGQ